MVAAYTTNLRLTKQGDNDNPNSWGRVTNEQVIALLEEAIAGVAEIDVTGSSDVNISTSTVNGGSDDARHAVLELSGTLGADINLIVPAVEKVYFLRTTHTGGTVTVKPSGGSSGISLTTNDVKIVYTKGTNIYNVVDVSGYLAIANNLSDLDDASDARDNLGLGDVAVLNVGSGLVINGTDLEAASIVTDNFGDVKMSAASTVPSGWLECDGSAVSRTTYSDLFSAIGTSFGSGDGSTTFNIPDFRGRSPLGLGQGNTAFGGGSGTSRTMGASVGTETHTLTQAETPLKDHVHLTTKALDPGSFAGSYSTSQMSGFVGGGHPTTQTQSAGSSSATSHNNMHPSLGIRFIIYTGV